MSTQRNAAYRWLPDDTEESIVGADWHQDAISSLCNGLRDVARAQRWPWHVGNQLTLLAWHPDGSPWRPIPDLMVHPRAGTAHRAEMDAPTDGLPALIVEVASPSTYRSDSNVAAPSARRREAKGFEYLAWPLPEYLVFDPTGTHLPGQVRGWRVVAGQVRVWQPDDDGRYQSPTLGVALRPEGFFLRVFSPAGNPVPFDHEKTDAIARLEQERAHAVWQAERAAEEVAALRAQIERLRGQDR